MEETKETDSGRVEYSISVRVPDNNSKVGMQCSNTVGVQDKNHSKDGDKNKALSRRDHSKKTNLINLSVN